MIFDSDILERLEAKHAESSEIELPRVLLVAKRRNLDGERKLLEDVIAEVPTLKQRDWLSRFANEDDGQHIGAWFEMMLYHWLKSCGTVDIEPDIYGSRPDFLISIGSVQIAVEARAVLPDDAEKSEVSLDAKFVNMLRSIARPFVIHIKKLRIPVSSLDATAFKIEIEAWLEQNPNTDYDYSAPDGSKIVLAAMYNPKITSVAVFGPTRVSWVNSEPLKAPLREKAKQHKSLRKAGHPYVIALLLDSYRLSADEVVEAMLGKEQIVFDIETSEVIDQRVDQTGIHFFRDEIRHRSVSGTLAFTVGNSSGYLGRCLRGWYIQNPYASQPISPRLFPTEQNYVVLSKSESAWQMGWQRSY